MSKRMQVEETFCNIDFNEPKNEEELEKFACRFFEDFEPEKLGDMRDHRNLEKLNSTGEVVFLGDLTLDFKNKLHAIGKIVFGNSVKSHGFSEVDYSKVYQMDSNETYHTEGTGTFVWVNMIDIVASNMEFGIQFVDEAPKEKTLSFVIGNLGTGTYKIETDFVDISFNAIRLDLTAAIEFLQGC